MELPLIVGVDGSPASLRALDWAVDEAVRRGTPLRAVYASSWEWYEGHEPSFGIGGDLVQASADHIVDRAVEHARRRTAAVDVTGTVLPEDPAAALIRASGEACAVVVGSRGRGQFAGLLLGSVSLSVAAHAASPVIVVRDVGGARETAGGQGVVGAGEAGESAAASAPGAGGSGASDAGSRQEADTGQAAAGVGGTGESVVASASPGVGSGGAPDAGSGQEADAGQVAVGAGEAGESVAASASGVGSSGEPDGRTSQEPDAGKATVGAGEAGEAAAGSAPGAESSREADAGQAVAGVGETSESVAASAPGAGSSREPGAGSRQVTAAGQVTVGVGAPGDSMAAVAFACEAAARRGAVLHAVHAWRCPAHEAPARPRAGELTDPHQRRAEEELDEALRAALRAHPTLVVRREVPEGHPRTALLDAARASDLLVVGARRRKGQLGMQLGPVNHAVLHHAACPVAVVPHG
ncbi:universal stress protein [Streptomyces sp. NPDC029674]|uniref:universal stress protein n=1 Tax=Streptomyces sp. NPDC029674 TaxID=3365297 RepID=UPI00384B0352